MAQTKTDRHVLSEDILARCLERAPVYDRENRFFTEDFDELCQAGYLIMAVPKELGGLGMSLVEVCREQRRLANHAPATALAINMHLYWTGVAADLWRAGDKSLEWLLKAAVAGEVFAAGHAETGNDVPLLLDGAFVPDKYIARVVPAGAAGVDHFVLAIFAWALSGFANVYYGLAQRALDLTIETIKKKTSVGLSRSMAYHAEVQHNIADIVPKYEQYGFIGHEPQAHPIAAMAQAAHDVLVEIYPAKQAVLYIELQKWLAQVRNDQSKTLGVKIGKQAAAAILARRKNDGHDARGEYKPGTNPGDYQYTPMFDFAFAPDFRYAKPFGLFSPDQFRSSPPPKLTSAEYAEAYYELKNYGVAKSKARSEDQTNYAHWWAEFAEHGLNRIGRLTAVERKLSLWETVRMFALINMSIFDFAVAAWDSKYHYHTWRPITAIRMGDKDGNPNTEPDSNWEPEMLTLPLPEYPSLHAAEGAGGAEILTHVYGTPNVSFSMESTTALPNAKVRSYDNLDRAADDCADSWVMNGFHFRSATEAGKLLGRRVARHIISNYLRPIAAPSK